MAISTPRDSNRISTLLATSSVDGLTPISVVVSSTSNRLKVSNGTSGSNLSFVNSQRDDNRIPTMWGVSSADGTTPIPIYCNASGALLTQTT